MVDTVPSSDSLVGSGPPPAQSQEDNISNIDNNDKVKSSPTTNSTDAETATTEMSMTPTKQPFLNSPSPITTNNRTPSPVALATAKFESKPESPPKTNKSISSSSPSGNNAIADMPPKKNALFSQWQQKSSKASPIIPGQKGNNTSDRPVYTGKRWSPPKKQQSASSVGSGVVTPSSPSKSTTPPFKPPRPPASPKASVSSDSTQPSSPQTALEKKFNNTNYEKKPSDEGSRNTKSSTLSKKSTLSTEEIIQSSTTQQISTKLAHDNEESHNEQSNKINNIESSLDDLRELKEQLRLATAAAGSGVIERDDVSVDEISVHANIEDLKSDMADEWKEKKEKVKSVKQKNQPAKVKKNKMASYWQKTSVGAPALKMDEKVSFRGYGAAKTAALEENKSYNRKSAGSTFAAAAIANEVSNGDDISVVAATKATVNAEDGFRARVVELVSLVMPGEIDHIDELIDEYEGREAELIDTLEAMRENEDLLGDDDDETALDDSTVREGEVIEASAKPWQSPAVGENIPPPENTSDNNNKSDTIQEHFKKLGAADAAAPVLSTDKTLEAQSSEVTDQVSNKSKEFMAVGMAEPVDEEAAIPNSNNNKEDGTNNSSKSRSLNQGVSWREKRFWDAKKIFIVVIALLVVVAIAGALGATLGGGGGDDKSSTPSQANAENDDAVSRDPTDYGQGTGIVSGVGVVNDSPTISPKEAPVDNSTPDNGIISAGDDTCIMNTFDTGVNTQQLEGVRSLSANYPKVAIDGNKAVVASGSGYVAFFEFNPTTNMWKRTEVFGLIANVGEVNSVAISGNVAVIGAPEAVTDISDDDPLKTGAVFIYEFDDTTLFEWRQKKGAYIPNDYKRATMDTYDGANFGQSVDVDGDLIVVGAPEENTNRGSITIFRRDDTSNEWVELKRMKPDDKLCGAEFFGYTVSIYEDVVAASADCDINIVVYKAQRDDDSGISIIPFQQLEYKDPSYGAVSSIAMSWDTLAYSTVSGGLFFYKRDNRDKRFFESQVMRFDVSQSLYEYPLTMDANMLVLAVMNDIFMYTHDAASKEWRQELLVLNSSGDYAGYVGASVSLSDGQLLAADRREVNAHDFTECLLTEEEFQVTTSSPSKKPTSSPVTSPPTQSPVQASTPPPTPPPVPPQPTPPPVPPVPTPPSDSDCDGHTLNIDVTLDQYPTDTRWEIIPQGQSTAIATSAPYDASLQFSPAETDSVCLPDGTYDFIIYDVYGDGICCDWGEGSYQLAFGDDIVASGGSFGKSETKTFSTPAASSTPSDPDCYPVSVSLNFDMYPQDESWDITQDGVIMASSTPVAADAKEDTQEVCLPAGDYVFTIYDVYGDGMCCQWGEGKYTVTTDPLQSSNGIIVEGAEFAASESTSFALPKF